MTAWPHYSPNHAINCQPRYIHFTTLHRSSTGKMENEFEEIIIWYVLQGGGWRGSRGRKFCGGKVLWNPSLGPWPPYPPRPMVQVLTSTRLCLLIPPRGVSWWSSGCLRVSPWFSSECPAPSTGLDSGHHDGVRQNRQGRGFCLGSQWTESVVTIQFVVHLKIVRCSPTCENEACLWPSVKKNLVAFLLGRKNMPL